MGVDRCVCREVPFEQVKALGAAGLTLRAIQERTGCGTGCGMCLPYVLLVLRTGKTDLPVLSGVAFDRLNLEAQEVLARGC